VAPGRPVVGVTASQALSDEALQDGTPAVAETTTSWAGVMTVPVAFAVNASAVLLSETLPAPGQGVKGVGVHASGLCAVTTAEKRTQLNNKPQE